jgi:hypothetical protein
MVKKNRTASPNVRQISPSLKEGRLDRPSNINSTQQQRRSFSSARRARSKQTFSTPSSALRQRFGSANTPEGIIDEQERKTKYSGVEFWLMMGVAFFKDTIDLVLYLTVVGAFLTVVTDIIFFVILVIYLLVIGERPNKAKFGSTILAVIVESIPVVEAVVPGTMLLLFVLRFLDKLAIKGESQGTKAVLKMMNKLVPH